MFAIAGFYVIHIILLLIMVYYINMPVEAKIMLYAFNILFFLGASYMAVKSKMRGK